MPDTTDAAQMQASRQEGTPTVIDWDAKSEPWRTIGKRFAANLAAGGSGYTGDESITSGHTYEPRKCPLCDKENWPGLQENKHLVEWHGAHRLHETPPVNER